jgi:hypothetical protein
MGTIFFNGAPVGDPNDPRGQKLLTVEVSKGHKPDEGMLSVRVHDVHGLDWIRCECPLSGLILCGLTSHGVADADEMLRLLDKALPYVPQWRERRQHVILPKPEPVDVVEEPAPKAAKAKP